MDQSNVEIIYCTAEGKRISVEVTNPVKELLKQSDRQIRSQRRQDRRHLSYAGNTAEELDNLLSPSQEDTADLLERKERDARLHAAIGQLTEVQERRLCLYYFDDLSYSQIARMEGVTHKAVIRSIEQALRSLRTLFSE